MAAEIALQFASELRGLETQAQDLEDAVSAAQGDVDTFFDSGAGVSFANSTEIGDRVAHLEAAQPIAAGLEGAAESAGRSCCLLQRTELDSALNLKDGTVYTVSGDIADEVAALETLLNGDEDAVYSADRVTGFLESQDRAIADLDDLNGQIDHSVVMREMSVSDAAPQLVSLDEAEVDRLGEGSVQIEARQTDAVGNVHEGGPATSSFVIDTIDPEVVTIADDQDGIAFDGANQVTYTLSFSEAVQSVTETDLTVTGAEGYTVSHEAGSDTASVTVTVADGSIEDVSVSVNSSILDIAGNPLIEAVDGDPDCRHGQSVHHGCS